MTPEQIERLKALQTPLVDILVQEADPQLWPGAGKQPTEMTRAERGDRMWSKKNANATAALIGTLGDLVYPRRLAAHGLTEPDSEQAARTAGEVQAAEREAARILRNMDRFDSKKMRDPRT